MSEKQAASQLSLHQVLQQEDLLRIQKAMVLEKAFKGDDAEEYYRAQSYLKKIEQRETVPVKSLLVDPMDLTASFGYKDKPFNLSYEVLRAMSRTPIVKAIIETRKEQVLDFCKPQKDKFSPGFVIKKKESNTGAKTEVKLTKEEEKKVEWLTEFLLGCGTVDNFWHADTFDNFIAKLVQDSLTFDQATFETIRDGKGDVVEFFTTDAGTFRVAETYNDTEEDTKYPDKVVKGYLPAYVQLYQAKVVAEFYPWELSFGIRNPQSDIRYNGYGRAELEDMIGTVTALLNADTYNANFFKVGSAPKGILKYSGNINQNTIEDFRRQWIAQVSGVMNAHKIPLINADKLDFINTMVNNKDMEYSKYQEFLIKVACAMYKIDPSEIGFPMSGNAGGESGLGGNNQEEKIKYSKDKGLNPLLSKIQYWINKHIIWQLAPEYEFRFVGIDEDDKQTDLERDVEMLGNFMTLNEIRAKRNLDPVENGDIPLNPVYVQLLQMQQQQEMQQQQMDQQSQEQPEEQDEDPFGADEQEFSKSQKNDPFKESLSKDLETLLCA